MQNIDNPEYDEVKALELQRRLKQISKLRKRFFEYSRRINDCEKLPQDNFIKREIECLTRMKEDLRKTIEELKNIYKCNSCPKTTKQHIEGCCPVICSHCGAHDIWSHATWSCSKHFCNICNSFEFHSTSTCSKKCNVCDQDEEYHHHKKCPKLNCEVCNGNHDADYCPQFEDERDINIIREMNGFGVKGTIDPIWDFN